MALKASADDTETAFSLLEAEEPPNFGPPMHIHHDAAEAFYVVSGEYRIFIEGEAAIDGSEMTMRRSARSRGGTAWRSSDPCPRDTSEDVLRAVKR